MSPRFVALILFPLLLCGCGGTGIDMVMQSQAQYAALPPNQVRVSSHPPKGQYQLLALMSLNAEANDTPASAIAKFQRQGASIGANYVWIVSGQDQTYIAPAISNTYSTANASGVGVASYDGYGNVVVAAAGSATEDSASTYMPSHNYVRTLLNAKALRIVSGNNEPDMSARSSLTPP